MTDIVIGQHARETYDQVQAHGDPSPCMPFPAPVIRTAIVVDALVVFPLPQEEEEEEEEEGETREEVCQGIVRAQDLDDNDDTARAYWPTRRLQKSLYGEVFACLALKRHVIGEADLNERQRQVAQAQGLDPFVWESTEEYVAIKRQNRNLFGNAADDPEMEVAVMQFLDVTRHINVLQSIEALQDATYLYTVTEYCRNGDLFDAVEKGGRMPEPVARFWFRQILSGLHHLQTQGICHRDLSPENILIQGDTLKKFDFGMALWEPYNNPTTNDGTVTNILGGKDRRLITRRKTVGKIRYMSPEIMSKKIFDGFAIEVLPLMFGQPGQFYEYFRTICVDGNLEILLQSWQIEVSHKAMDLLQNMLWHDPRERLSLAQVIEHPWVTNPDVEHPAGV